MRCDLSAAITGVVCSGLHFRHQLFLAFGKFLVNFHPLNFADQVLDGSMFDGCFVDQIVILGRLASLQVEISSPICA